VPAASTLIKTTAADAASMISATTGQAMGEPSDAQMVPSDSKQDGNGSGHKTLSGSLDKALSSTSDKVLSGPEVRNIDDLIGP
jgi:hypothetical protein